MNGSSSSYYDAMTDDIEPPQKTKTNSQYSNRLDSKESRDWFQLYSANLQTFLCRVQLKHSPLKSVGQHTWVLGLCTASPYTQARGEW